MSNDDQKNSNPAVLYVMKSETVPTLGFSRTKDDDDFVITWDPRQTDEKEILDIVEFAGMQRVQVTVPYKDVKNYVLSEYRQELLRRIRNAPLREIENWMLGYTEDL